MEKNAEEVALRNKKIQEVKKHIAF